MDPRQLELKAAAARPSPIGEGRAVVFFGEDQARKDGSSIFALGAGLSFFSGLALWAASEGWLGEEYFGLSLMGIFIGILLTFLSSAFDGKSRLKELFALGLGGILFLLLAAPLSTADGATVGFGRGISESSSTLVSAASFGAITGDLDSAIQTAASDFAQLFESVDPQLAGSEEPGGWASHFFFAILGTMLPMLALLISLALASLAGKKVHVPQEPDSPPVIEPILYPLLRPPG